jgi:hypothetical protein
VNSPTQRCLVFRCPGLFCRVARQQVALLLYACCSDTKSFLITTPVALMTLLLSLFCVVFCFLPSLCEAFVAAPQFFALERVF